MSTSFLYHTQGVKGFQFQSFDYSGGRVAARITRKPGTFFCPECGAYHTTPTYTGERTIKALPMGSKDFVLQVAMHRIRCHRCAAFRMEPLPFLPSAKARVTRSLARSIIELRGNMSIIDLAAHFNLHWTTVKNIEKKYLKKKFKRIRLRDVRWIGVDEVHVGNRLGEKGFITVVRDMKSGAVLHVGKGRGGDALKDFTRRVKHSKCKIEAVAMDFSPAYKAWAAQFFPKATLVFDHFHLIKLMNDKIDTIRRRIMSRLEENDKKALKYKRWHFLRNQEGLDADAEAELHKCREQFEELGTAWYMKESLRRIYSLAWDADSAALAFDRWCELADATNISQLHTMARTIRRNIDGITAYWTTGMTSASMEGFNNKIRWLNSQAYGYHDEEYFLLKVFDLPYVKNRRDL